MAITRTFWFRSALLIGAGLLAVTGLLTLLPGGAEADDPPVHGEPLTTEGTHNTFTDDVAVQVRDKPDGRSTEVVNLRDASNIAVFEFTIQPGAWFHWHTHPGPVLAAAEAGDLVFIYADDCVERRYSTGDAFVDPGVIHTAHNPGEEPTTVIATVLGVAEGAPAATAVSPEEGEALNDACGTDAPTAH